MKKLSTVKSGNNILQFMKINKIDEIAILGFKELGFNEKAYSILADALKHDNGLFLVTGKTNSGKTTLLTALEIFENLELNKTTSTIKKSVEIFIDFKKIVTKTFAKNNLRNSVLNLFREDVDVIVIDKLGDKEEDKKFIDIGIRGNLSIGGMHTEDIFSTIDRLMESAENKEDVNSNLRLIVSTELIPKKCQECGGKGCEKCKNGAVGILPIFSIAHFKDLDYDDDIFNFNSLVSNGKLDYYSKKDFAQKYLEDNLIFEEDYENVLIESQKENKKLKLDKDEK